MVLSLLCVCFIPLLGGQAVWSRSLDYSSFGAIGVITFLVLGITPEPFCESPVSRYELNRRCVKPRVGTYDQLFECRV